MKVIITGATGLVGGAVVRHCIAHADITAIIVLSRRELPKSLTSSPKVTVILHQDFLTYPQDVLEKVKGAEACYWALGLRGAPLGYSDIDAARTIDVEYPVAAARAFAANVVPTDRPFRFVLCSGIGAEFDEEKPLWFMRDTRRLKGLAEKSLREFTTQNPQFETYTCRPFGIVPEDASWFRLLPFLIMPAVNVGDLAAVMVDLGAHGSDQWIWEHEAIVKRGSIFPQPK